MKSHIDFFSHSNFGDTFEHLNYVRRLSVMHPSATFVQYTKTIQVEQLAEFVEDLPNISVRDIKDQPANAVCSWPGHEGFIHRYPNRNSDRVTFLIEWFRHLSRVLDTPNPVESLEDLIFGAAALTQAVATDSYKPDFDILLINSSPCSGQYRAYSPEALAALARRLSEKHLVITTEKVDGISCTRDFNLSLCAIGSLSGSVKAVTGIATGPIWPTINKWNHGKLHYVYMVDHEYINYGPNYHKAVNENDAFDILTGILQ